MKILIAFYSRSGITRRTAKDLKCLLEEKGAEVELEDITDRKDRSGKLGYAAAGKDAFLAKETEIDDAVHDPRGFDLIILGTPVWAGTVACALRTYLKRYGEHTDRVAFFCTHGGGGPSKTFRVMKELSGCEPGAVTSLYDKDVKAGKHLEELKAFSEQLF